MVPLRDVYDDYNSSLLVPYSLLNDRNRWLTIVECYVVYELEYMVCFITKTCYISLIIHPKDHLSPVRIGKCDDRCG